ncbi:MAG: hypothetical protein Q8M07_32875, partial [Prosthecobacter sp.]|nr:hypothetical protein [Prosthecobacter sp.]
MGVTSPSQRGAFIAKLGAWMQAAPLLGIAAMMFGMAEIIAALGTSDAASYTARVSEVRGYMRNYTAIAVSMALIGLVLVTVAITAYRYRSKWMFKFLRFYGVLTIALSLVLVFGQFKINL